MSIEPTTASQRPGRLLLWLGVLVAILGPVLYAGQIATKHLTTPWYVPVSGTVGAAIVIWCIIGARTVTRFVVLAMAVLLAAAEWHFIVKDSRLPDYAGPIIVGQPVMHFTSTLASGTGFTDKDLIGPKNTALVLFRGRW